MKRTVIRDYRKVCADWGIMKNEDDFNRSESKHELINGSYLDFLGADVSDVGKGFRRSMLYINEADKLTLDQAVQFISRAGLTVIDFNPDRRFWGHDYIKENNFITLTFEDNEFLPQHEVDSILDYKIRGFKNPNIKDINKLFEEQNIKSKYWANKWRVYGLGLLGMLEGVVFENWSKIQNVPQGAELLAYGVDWGYSVSSTTLMELYKWQGKLVINELIYQTGLLNNDVISLMNKLNVRRDVIIICDSEDPKSRDELRIAGYYAMPCKKNADTKRQGIAKLQEFELLITESSHNTIRDFENYTWKKNANNESIGIPEKKFDHSIDPLIYIAYTEMNPKPTIEL